jgi:hypothetical protein
MATHPTEVINEQQKVLVTPSALPMQLDNTSLMQYSAFAGNVVCCCFPAWHAS